MTILKKYCMVRRAFLFAATLSWMACSTPSTNSFVLSVRTYNVTESTVDCSISVSVHDMGIIAESGVCYSRDYTSPSISYNTVILGYGAGEFKGEVSYLEPGTSYSIRAYAKTNAGVVYSDIVYITTATKSTNLYYGSGTYDDACGLTDGANNGEWGVMFPASVLRSYEGKYISKVSAYITEPGDYKLTLYQGGTSSPSSTLTTRYYAIDNLGWRYLVLPTPIPLNTSTSLWATLSLSYDKGTYPMAYSTGAYDSNANWIKHSNNTWGHVTVVGEKTVDLSWLIQVVLSDVDTKGGEDVILSWDGPAMEETAEAESLPPFAVVGKTE